MVGIAAVSDAKKEQSACSHRHGADRGDWVSEGKGEKRKPSDRGTVITSHRRNSECRLGMKMAQAFGTTMGRLAFSPTSYSNYWGKKRAGVDWGGASFWKLTRGRGDKVRSTNLVLSRTSDRFFKNERENRGNCQSPSVGLRS